VLEDSEVERILVVTAHPDDVDFGAAGTVALWTDAGIAVSYCVCTDGQAGGFDPDIPREKMPTIRRQEQIEAAKAVGVTDVRFLGHHDGELEPNRELVRDIVRVIRAVRPQRVVLQNPERNWDRTGASHPDHLAAGEATMRAVYPAARNPFAFPELLADGLEEWVVPEIWVTATTNPSRFVDVTDQFDRKIEALMAHHSQHPDRERVPVFVREFMAKNAEKAGLAEGRLAEAFRVHETA